VGFVWSFFGPVHVFFFILFMEVPKITVLWLSMSETPKIKGTSENVRKSNARAVVLCSSFS